MTGIDTFTNSMHLNSEEAVEIADYWVELSEASVGDAKARAFLGIFEPWAKAVLNSVPKS